jgi:1-acylglycerone phosphate reductase
VGSQNHDECNALSHVYAQAYSLPATDITMNQVRKLFDVNVFGVMNMCQTFVPLLRASTYLSGARILNIGSVVGIMPAPFEAAYNASKAAIHSYGDTLRVELEPFG